MPTYKQNCSDQLEAHTNRSKKTSQETGMATRIPKLKLKIKNVDTTLINIYN
jgi:hypothetical protein